MNAARRLFRDPAGNPPSPNRRAWIVRIAILIVLLTVMLTWAEWRKNHPQDIALVALLHLVVVSIVVSGLIYLGGWIRRTAKKW